MKHICFLIAMLLWGPGVTVQAELIVKHKRPESATDQRDAYYLDMLRLALEKTEKTDGAFRLEMSKILMNQARVLEYLKQNRDIDVAWSMTSKEREAELRPVRIPLLKGLLGYRIFIIRSEDKEKFASVNSLEDLKNLKAGQGHDWTDTRILKANGLPVVTGTNYEGLFGMLLGRRFDYFPRGVNEPWAEIRAHEGKDLMVEATLLLQYPAPIYFFVHKQNTKLADRLERGLRLAIKDGSFDHLFRNHPVTREIFELANMEKRKIFRLKNPLLPPETPLGEKTLWYTLREREKEVKDEP